MEDCVQCVNEHSDNRIFLITSGTFGKEIVPQIYDIEHLGQIFVFCGNIQSHLEWAIDFIDKTLMFEHEQDLIERLANELAHYLQEDAKACTGDQAEKLAEWANKLFGIANKLRQPCG
ncbi:unnamed protein product [Didymodactylos carnosus]|uniref:Uncharacterized protein n=1 Tax=Didymodactylos carnosus TaxID=1234261 RepID=A0A815GYV2_9BILA|nr:unnamed protein product [Didymodactylos carnosus]CAF4213507.1 unnamed protein product [Didymodactylos carnosus]